MTAADYYRIYRCSKCECWLNEKDRFVYDDHIIWCPICVSYTEDAKRLMPKIGEEEK